MARIFASRFACVSTTPLGSPVEPEVYCNSAISLALRTRLPERCAGNAPGAGGGALSAAARSFSASATDLSDWTRGFSNFATASARRKVNNRHTSALLRMADWRSAYSSMRSARKGG